MIGRPFLLVAALASLACAGAGPADPDTPAPLPWVAVPRATGAYDLIAGYRRLHRVGLRMAILQPFSLGSLCLPSARTQFPSAGARLRPGGTVTIGRLACPLASPAGGGQPALVPDFTGRPASAAVSWAERAGLYWQLDRLAPLRPSARGGLLDNYIVTTQSPPAGALLGRGVDCSTYAARCFRATPLRMRARERHG